jgi:hypothetical protein
MGIGGTGFGTYSLSQSDAEYFVKRAVWNKAWPILGLDSDVWRQDVFGNKIYFFAHGDRSSEFGWEMDHSPVPSTFGGADHISNLRPLHWRANASLGGTLAALMSI